MKNFKSAWVGLAAALSLVAGLAAFGAMAAPEHVKAGTLDCDVSGGVGLIIGSQKQMSCVFTPVNGGRREAYLGTIHKFGLDIAATAGGQMAWAVFSPTNQRFAALSGTYAGARAVKRQSARA
jgi:hypothetical protein